MIIQIKNLKYSYPHTEKEIFHDFALDIKEGEWISILGKNGSGKSTLAKIIMGLLEIQEGSIYIKDKLLNNENINEIRQKIGMVFQNPDNQFVGVTVEDDVAFGLENMQVDPKDMDDIIENALSIVGMSDFRKKEPHNLSGGQKQRVAMASVLALNPEIIILDEATSMLNPQGRNQVLAVLADLKIKNPNLTVIMITHDMDEAMLTDRVVVINDGKIVSDGIPKEVFSDENIIRKAGLELPFSGELQKLINKDAQYYMDESELKAWLLNLKK